MVLAGLPAQANESQTPWECSSYTGDAHTRCVEAFAAAQRDQIAALQAQMQAQQETINRIQNQLDRQTSKSADLQRRLAQPPAVVQTVPPYAYPLVGLGLGLYVDHPWNYGPPFFYRPYVYSPRYYGPGYWSFRW
jgi:uncharacterized coiled-coil protein SlyX